MGVDSLLLGVQILGNQAQVVRLGGKHLYLMRYLGGLTSLLGHFLTFLLTSWISIFDLQGNYHSPSESHLLPGAYLFIVVKNNNLFDLLNHSLLCPRPQGMPKVTGLYLKEKLLKRELDSREYFALMDPQPRLK